MKISVLTILMISGLKMKSGSKLTLLQSTTYAPYGRNFSFYCIKDPLDKMNPEEVLQFYRRSERILELIWDATECKKTYHNSAYYNGWCDKNMQTFVIQRYVLYISQITKRDGDEWYCKLKLRDNSVIKSNSVNLRLTHYTVKLLPVSQYAVLGKRFSFKCEVRVTTGAPNLHDIVCFHRSTGRKWCLQQSGIDCKLIGERDFNHKTECNDLAVSGHISHLRIYKITIDDLVVWWCSIKKLKLQSKFFKLREPSNQEKQKEPQVPVVHPPQKPDIFVGRPVIDIDIVVAVVEAVERLAELSSVNASMVEKTLSSVNSLLSFSANILRSLDKKNKMFKRLIIAVDKVLTKVSVQNSTFLYADNNLAAAVVKSDSQITPGMVMKIDTNSLTGIHTMTVQARSSISSVNHNITNTLFLPPSLFKLYQPSDRNLKVVFTAYKDDAIFWDLKLLKNNSLHNVSRHVNSVVLSADIANVNITDLNEPVLISFVHKYENSSNPQCVQWSYRAENDSWEWSGDGCSVVSMGKLFTTCACTYLTHFTLLMNVPRYEESISNSNRADLYFISYIGCCVSAISLLFTVLTYTAFRSLFQDVPSRILVNICVGLLATNILFVFDMQKFILENDLACKIVAGLTHFFLLSVVMWMMLEAVNMYLSHVVTFLNQTRHLILMYMCFGYGIPLIIVVTVAVYRYGKNYGLLKTQICWIKSPISYHSFLAPMVFILMVNSVCFVLTFCQIVRVSGGAVLDTSSKAKLRMRLIGAVAMIVLLSFTYLFAVFAISKTSLVFAYLFAISNSALGLFVFLFYYIVAWKSVIPIQENLEAKCSRSEGDGQSEVPKNESVDRSAGQNIVPENESVDRSAGESDWYNEQYENQLEVQS